MKYLFFALIYIISVSAVSAAPLVTKVNFKPIGSTTDITCTVFGMKKVLPSTSNGGAQIFAPDPTLSRTLALGTATMKSYSTARRTGENLAIEFVCVQTGTDTTVPVKFFLNDTETHFLVLERGQYGIN